MIVTFLLAFLWTIFFVFLLVPIVRRFARQHGIVDRPEDAPMRKIHPRPVPLLGGVAIYVAIVVVLILLAVTTDRLLGGYLLLKHLVGMILGGAVLMIGGSWDDAKHLSPHQQMLWPLLAVGMIIASGIGVDYISNPLGDTIRLDTVHWTLFQIGDLPYGITLWADVFTAVWLLGMIYTTKFLDGLDGLATGVTAIGSLIIFVLSLLPEVGQPETALLAWVLFAACLAFLVFNFYPASIFLGEGGSTFFGFMLGVLAIISGGKIATALLVLGIPILDVAWVILRRIFQRTSPFWADRKHLHYRLLDAGLSHRQTVLTLYVLTALFGTSSLVLQKEQKIVALGMVVVVMAGLAGWVFWRYRRKGLTTAQK
jgi:UDP-GlcNAc:undecaprenyl-phosphate GlcNAc-1-phosphate transferase